MNSSLKQKIEEAAERRSVDADACCECEAEESFKAGAQFLLDEGYQFTAEDMIDFCKWFNSDLWEYEYRDEETYSEDQAFEIWLKERENK